MLSQNEVKWSVVRIPAELLVMIEKIVREEKDQFGMPKYHSRSEVVTEAVKEFLKKHSEESVDQ